MLGAIKEAILSIPQLIIDGLKEIFIPDTEELSDIMEAMLENLGSQLGADFTLLNNLFNLEIAPEDVSVDYDIPGLGTMRIPILDTQYLISGVAHFRPYIRGFTVFLLVCFNWFHVLSLIGQDPRIAQESYNGYVEDKMKKSGRFIGGGK